MSEEGIRRASTVLKLRDGSSGQRRRRGKTKTLQTQRGKIQGKTGLKDTQKRDKKEMKMNEKKGKMILKGKNKKKKDKT
ncbi:hypothetical protein RUM43_008204 [Polyplax serrata]|uniref:Uncharacterized protein n=1 Tax=Polyplax serrata TaxID=468196 RepID=A0AAN8PNR5_POLSC